MRAAAAAVVAASALALPAAAAASTAKLSYDEPVPGIAEGAYALSVTGTPGEANRIAVSSDASGYTVADAGARITAGDGCVAATSSRVRCEATQPAPDRSVFVDGGDGNDRIALGALAVGTFTEVRGGTGADVLYGSALNDLLYGGAGDDGLVGGAAFDTLDGGPGDDVLHGGPGTDTASYEQRRTPVAVDLARGTGGGPGESDTVSAVEEVVGGLGADELLGSREPDSLLGGEGDAHDLVDGRGGDDVLIGFRAIGRRGNDSLDGRRLSCGAGLDTVYRGRHRAPGPFPHGCETVNAVFVMLRAQAVRTSRRAVVVALRCKSAPRCRGRLSVLDHQGQLGTARFAVRAGDDPAALHRVRIRLSRRPARPVATLRIDGIRAYQRSSFRVRVR